MFTRNQTYPDSIYDIQMVTGNTPRWFCCFNRGKTLWFFGHLLALSNPHLNKENYVNTSLKFSVCLCLVHIEARGVPSTLLSME